MRIPSAAEYEKALVEMATEISPFQREMLGAHYHAPNRTITYTQLAKAAGYESYEVANRWYGQLGKDIGAAVSRTAGREFEFVDLDPTKPDVPFYSSAIGMGAAEGYKAGDEFELVMHHELAKALDRLRWFTPASHS